MTKLTDAEIAEIRKREQAATPGPWQREAIFHMSDAHWPKGAVVLNYERVYCQTNGLDAEFVASARADIPRMLAHIEAQAKEIEKVRRALDLCAQQQARK